MENAEYKKLMRFHGSHNTLVSLRIINNILKVVTLGFYYPWARVAVLNYMYGESEFQGSRFVFHGTGKEIFKGYIKGLFLLILLYSLIFYSGYTEDPIEKVVCILVFFVGFTAIIPLIIHGAMKYRLSRSSWRGIHFGYRGEIGEFYKMYIGNMLLTMVTFGLYSSWMQVAVKKYLYGHARFGNIEFSFTGRGMDLFIIRLKGVFLSIITLGIYLFWYVRDLARFEFSNIKITQDGRQINVRTSITPGKLFGMMITNYFIIVLTLGIGTGIAINRFMRVSFENLEFDGEIDTDRLLQTEEEYKDATGDDMAGFLDISII